MHSRDDLRVPLSSARDLASMIPDAQLVSLPSRNHILLDEPAWPIFLAEIDRFLADLTRPVLRIRPDRAGREGQDDRSYASGPAGRRGRGGPAWRRSTRRPSRISVPATNVCR